MGTHTLALTSRQVLSSTLGTYTYEIFPTRVRIASLGVASGNPADHLVHRHTHRVVRGSLLAVGRPDARLNALTSAENTVCLSVSQASSIQNYGVTCESVTVGHNSFELPLAANCITLAGSRPQFLCERELELKQRPRDTPL